MFTNDFLDEGILHYELCEKPKLVTFIINIITDTVYITVFSMKKLVLPPYLNVLLVYTLRPTKMNGSKYTPRYF